MIVVEVEICQLQLHDSPPILIKAIGQNQLVVLVQTRGVCHIINGKFKELSHQLRKDVYTLDSQRTIRKNKRRQVLPLKLAIVVSL